MCFSRNKLQTFRDLNLICHLLLSASPKVSWYLMNLNLSIRAVPEMLHSVVEFPFLTQGINFSSCLCAAVICAAVAFVLCILRLGNPSGMFMGVQSVSCWNEMSEALALTSPVMIVAPNKAHTESLLTEDFCMLSFVFLRTSCNYRNLIPWGSIGKPHKSL